MSNILSKDDFHSFLKTCPDSNKYWVALSGGLDSCVLLYLFYLNKKRINQKVQVVYVDHQLQKLSQDWDVFCKALCQDYGFDYQCLKITGSCPKEMSVEEWAREERYKLISDEMEQDDILFTAHHQDDQMETFFLQMLRGSGPRGLVAMPVHKVFFCGYHIRPFLDCSRNDLQLYAKKNGLKYINDPSNEDVRFNRNYLRNKLLPLIKERWPGYKEAVSRLIKHQQEVKLLLDEVADQDLVQALLESSSGIDMKKIEALSISRKKNLIAYWLKQQGLNQPNAKHMEQLINDIFGAAEDKNPCVNWEGVEVRRYRNILYALKPLQEHNPLETYQWNLNQSLLLDDDCLSAGLIKGQGIAKKHLDNDVVEVRFRQGGEKIRPYNQKVSKTVKQIFQEKGVLPWYRDRIPLVYVDGQLAVIPGICISELFCADKDENAWQIEWSGFRKAIQ